MISFMWLESLSQDVRFALRGMRRSPVFTACVVLTVAVGVGLNAAVFTIANAVLFRGFPFVVHSDRVLYLQGPNYSGVSYPDFVDWRAASTSFGEMAAYSRGRPVSLSGQGGLPESYYQAQISTNTFHLLGLVPILGRDLNASDAVDGAPPVAILSYSVWQGRFGSNPSIIGQTVRINGAPTTIVGVLPDGAAFLPGFAVWVPLVQTPQLMRRDSQTLWFVLGRLTEGATLQSARADIAVIGRRLSTQYPADKDVVPEVHDFNELWSGPRLTNLYESMWIAAAFVLLIVCANLANLLLARGVTRAREVSLRIAIGAGRWRIVRQLLVESLILSAIGGALGWAAAVWGVRVYVATTYPGPFTSWSFDMDWHVAAYVFAVVVATATLFGLAPALRLVALDVNSTLKDAGRGTSGSGRARRLSTFLVAAEMALAVTLLTGAGLMTRSFLNVYKADLGFDASNVLTGYFALPTTKYPGDESILAFYDRLELRLRSVAGVESIAMASRLPTQGSSAFSYDLPEAGTVDPQHRPKVSSITISPGYLEALRVRLIAGRAFDEFDGMRGLPVIMVNQQFASEQWPNQSPLGRRLRLFNGPTADEWRTVVGVVSNVVQKSLRPNAGDGWRGETEPLVYLPYRQRPASGMWFFARTRISPETLVTEFREAAAKVDPDLPIDGPRGLIEQSAILNAGAGANTALFGLFALVALLLASLGLFAVVANWVSQRTPELGVRIAIGATRSDIISLVLGQGLYSVTVGLIIGLAASFTLTPALQSSLVNVSSADPITFATAPLILIAAAALGCLLPALRATRIDPVSALRQE